MNLTPRPFPHGGRGVHVAMVGPGFPLSLWDSVGQGWGPTGDEDARHPVSIPEDARDQDTQQVAAARGDPADDHNLQRAREEIERRQLALDDADDDEG